MLANLENFGLTINRILVFSELWVLAPMLESGENS
jgi:hypothetical protein